MHHLILLWLASAAIATAADIAWLSGEVVNKARAASVIVATSRQAGVVGFFASEDGLVVTTAMTLEGVKNPLILTADSRQIEGVTLMAMDSFHNLAVLATHQKTRAYLQVRQIAAQSGETCAAISMRSDGTLKISDGMLMAHKPTLDWTETRFQKLWSVLLSPATSGLAGAPIITSDGCVAAICSNTSGSGNLQLAMAFPESAIQEVLTQARAATKPLPFPPKPANDPSGDRDYDNGLAKIRSGNPEGARANFQAALARQPQNVLILNQLAQACIAAGDRAEGRKLHRECARLAPERLLSHVHEGLALEAEGKDEEAIRHYQDLVTRHPNLSAAWGGLGLLLHKTGRHAEAVAATRRWTELQPELAATWNAYSTCLTDAGDPAEADRARNKAWELDDLQFKIRYGAPKRK
jgi:Flp pilus assembly protein TadD